MSNLTVQSLSAPAGSGNRINVPSPNVLYAPGHVIQVRYAYLNTPVSTSSASFIDLGLDVSIVPKSTSSIFKLETLLYAGIGTGDPNIPVRFTRNNVPLPDLPSGIGSRLAGHGGGYIWTTANDTNTQFALPAISIDAPNTVNTITYRVQFASAYPTKTIAIGSSVNNADATYSTRQTTYLIVTEIAQ